MNIPFELYRYQILPRDRYFQGDLFDGVHTVEELLEQKNALFFRALQAVKSLQSERTPIIWKPQLLEEEFSLIRIAPNRSLRRETANFTEEDIENWPSLFIGVWNKPDKQLFFVQQRPEAFQSSETVVRAVASAISAHLHKMQLRVHTEPIVKSIDFWKLVERFEGKITDVRFDLVTPNMSNISEVLTGDIKQLAKDTNTAKTKIELTSDPDSALILNPSNKELSGIVQYSSDGGGNISVKAKGVRKRTSTSDTKSTVELDEVEIQGKSAQEIISLMKTLFE